MWAFHPKMLHSFSKIKKKRGHAHFLSRQLLEQREMEATLHTAAGMSGCSVRRLVVTFICFFNLIYLFFCLLVASLLHSHSRWDERTDEIRSLCAAERSSDSCSDKSSSTLATDRLTACLQGRQPFFFIHFLFLHMHECTTADKKTPTIHM